MSSRTGTTLVSLLHIQSMEFDVRGSLFPSQHKCSRSEEKLSWEGVITRNIFSVTKISSCYPSNTRRSPVFQQGQSVASVVRIIPITHQCLVRNSEENMDTYSLEISKFICALQIKVTKIVVTHLLPRCFICPFSSCSNYQVS